MAAEAPIQIGILSSTNISRKFARAFHLAPNATISAVATHSTESAKAFATTDEYYPTVKIHESYESLLEDPDVDALYVPLPTSLHVEWTIRAANKGKHILLEKPVAMNVAELDRILAACEANGIQIMDGTMWVHNPRTQKMKEFLSDPERFGQLKTVHSCFSFAADEDFLKNDIRVKPGLDGLGALGDAGWYTATATLFANNYELPETVTALPGSVLNDAGVVLSCGAFLHWEDGKTATISCSFLGNLTMDMTAIGTKGTLYVHDFVIPFQDTEASFTTSTKAWFNNGVTGWVNKPNEHKIMTELPQEACMVREFARLVGEIKNKGAKPDGFWPSISRKTQLIIDAVKESIDKNFQPISLSARGSQALNMCCCVLKSLGGK